MLQIPTSQLQLASILSPNRQHLRVLDWAPWTGLQCYSFGEVPEFFLKHSRFVALRALVAKCASESGSAVSTSERPRQRCISARKAKASASEATQAPTLCTASSRGAVKSGGAPRELPW